MNRRDFVSTSTALLAGSMLGARSTGDSARQDQSSDSQWVPNRIAVSTYSFWRFRDDSKLTMTKCIDHAARWGFDGVELLEIQMEEKSDDYLRKLKRQAFVNGMDLVGISTHQDFVSPDAADRKKNVQRTNNSIELAYKLGIPTIPR